MGRRINFLKVGLEGLSENIHTFSSLSLFQSRLILLVLPYWLRTCCGLVCSLQRKYLGNSELEQSSASTWISLDNVSIPVCCIDLFLAVVLTCFAVPQGAANFLRLEGTLLILIFVLCSSEPQLDEPDIPLKVNNCWSLYCGQIIYDYH